MPTTRGSSAACHRSWTVSTRSRVAAEQAAAQQAATVDFGRHVAQVERQHHRVAAAPWRAERPRGEEDGDAADREQRQGADGRQQANDESPHGEYSVRLSGFHEIGPERLDRVKHRRGAGVEPVVAHRDGGRHAAHRAASRRRGSTCDSRRSAATKASGARPI